MWQRLGIDWAGVAAVVIAAVGIYIVFLVLVRVFGQRPLARMSSSDVIVVLALGSIAGRAVLGTSITLLAGAVALAALFVLRWFVERISGTRWGRVIVRTPPVLLMVDGVEQHDLLRQARVSTEELHGILRTAGIRHSAEVACVILESAGAISVTRKGALLERQLFDEVAGADRIPPALLGP